MSEYDFKEIKNKLSSSLKMKLDHIKRFLTQGNASVLVVQDLVRMQRWMLLYA